MDSFRLTTCSILGVVAFVLPLFTEAQGTLQEIFTLDAFSLQQTCVQYCFTTSLSGCTTDVLAEAIGCSYNPCKTPFQAVDNCYCRADLQTAAQSFLTSCIKTSCTVGDTSINIASASSIYAGYCTSRGYTGALPAQNTAQTTSGSGSDASATSNSRTGTTSTSSTASSDDTSTSNKSSSNTLTIALGAVGGIAGLAIIVAIIFFWKFKQTRRYPQNANAPYIHRRPVFEESPSTQYLRSQVGSRLSDDAPTIFPHESASVVGQPVNLPQYPAALPSLVSTNRFGDDESRIGSRRNRPQY